MYPNSHYVAPPEYMEKAITTIEAELVDWLPKMRSAGKLEEASGWKSERVRPRLLTQFGNARIENTAGT